MPSFKHVGLRGAIYGWEDYEDDHEFGFVISHAEDIEEVGWKGVVQKIRDTVGDNPVYSEMLVFAVCGRVESQVTVDNRYRRT